jgi:DNA invertase Pin-like site-specific DNA recombinase
LIDVATDLADRGVGFRSLTESIDTTTPGGRLIFHMFGALAQFERELVRERTLAGLAAARAQGRNGGRPTIMPRTSWPRPGGCMSSGSSPVSRSPARSG